MQHHAHDADHRWMTLARMLGQRMGRLGRYVIGAIIVLLLLTLAVQIV